MQCFHANIDDGNAKGHDDINLQAPWMASEFILCIELYPLTDIPVVPPLPTTISTNVSLEDDDYADGVDNDYEEVSTVDDEVSLDGKTRASRRTTKTTKRMGRPPTLVDKGDDRTMQVTVKSQVDRTRIGSKPVNILILLSASLMRHVGSLTGLCRWFCWPVLHDGLSIS